MVVYSSGVGDFQEYLDDYGIWGPSEAHHIDEYVTVTYEVEESIDGAPAGNASISGTLYR